jgi:tyrosyl-tRNA synthetase
VPQFELPSAAFEKDVLELLAVETGVFSSKGEARRMITGGGVSINKEKITSLEARIGAGDLINGKYLLVQKGKKNYYLLRVKG